MQNQHFEPGTQFPLETAAHGFDFLDKVDQVEPFEIAHAQKFSLLVDPLREVALVIGRLYSRCGGMEELVHATSVNSKVAPIDGAG
jgi:hypothetical protein